MSHAFGPPCLSTNVRQHGSIFLPKPSNEDMKSIGIFLFATASCLLVSTDIVAARGVRIWSHQELFDKSDLVVIATLTATNDTQEHIDLPGFAGERVVGVETRFSVSAVLKGDKAASWVVLHHYRTADGTNIPHVINGPSFVSFDPPKNPIFNAVREAPPVWRTYILFLVRETDGRYEPVVGQAEPGSAFKELIDTTGVSFGQERGLEFLSNIPELRDLSLKMSEDRLKSHIEKHGLYAKKELQKERLSYWVLTSGGENVFVGFEAGKCMGIQRMQPIPKQRIQDEIGASEYRTWMA